MYPYGNNVPLQVRGEFWREIKSPSGKMCVKADLIVVEENSFIDANLLGNETATILNMLS